MTGEEVGIYVSREDGLSFVDAEGEEIITLPPDAEILLQVREAIDDLIATLRHAAH